MTDFAKYDDRLDRLVNLDKDLCITSGFRVDAEFGRVFLRF